MSLISEGGSPNSSVGVLEAPSCLGTMRVGCRERGFSARAANFLAAMLRVSTCEVYERKWATFCIWCAERPVDIFTISIGFFMDFLVHLYDTVFLTASTI